MRRATALATLALGLTAVGCGTPGRAPPPGRELFTHSCGFCHSLTGHDSPAKQGGDLLGLHLRRPVALQFAREMPVRHPLSRDQLAAIVDYIAAVQRGR